ncbi:hypothetical protein [Herbaspirillum sp. YR522]|uniref:hypothetical protein n=1 Tax=Herbaspirillum sp. YR522 TaxID=1144342 RepID=UPI00026FA25E|nr:hypothetical protein [Herbaspirillum sp. YR522]EJN07859.1 hypothetical protein PMI40_01612 [Herbaspirillum sp. YR522]
MPRVRIMLRADRNGAAPHAAMRIASPDDPDAVFGNGVSGAREQLADGLPRSPT